MRSKFDNKLQELFDDYSVPLKDTQWVRMEAAILAKKKSRKKWWVFLWAIFAVGMMSFAAGYWLSKPEDTLAQNNKETKSLVKQQAEQLIAKPETLNKDNTNIETLNNQKTNNNENRVDNDNNINKELSPSVTDISKEVEKGRKVVSNGNGDETRANKGLNNNSSRSPFSESVASKNLTNLNPNLPKSNGALTKSRPNFEFNFESWKRAIYPLASGFVNPQTFYSSAYLKAVKPEGTEHSNIRKVLMKVKNSMSVDLVAGGFVKNTSFIPRAAGDSAIQFILPELKTSFEKQLAQGSGSRFGIQLRSDVFKGFSLSSGLIYQSTRETTQFEHIHNRVPFYDTFFNIIGFIEYDDANAPRSQVEVNNRIDYLQVPLQLRFDQRISAKWRAGVSVSHNFNMPIKFDVKYYDVLRFQYQKIDKEMMQLGGNTAAGVHLDYKLWKPIWLGLNYQYTQQKNNVTWQQQAIDLKDINHRINLSLNIKL